MKVLLVDDSSTMRRIQRRHLESLDVTDIVEAGGGCEAFAAFESCRADGQPFDFVLADIRMPMGDGLELLIAIRGVDPSVPVVLVTTESDRSIIVPAIRAGVTDYMVKPFSPQCLDQKLSKWVLERVDGVSSAQRAPNTFTEAVR